MSQLLNKIEAGQSVSGAESKEATNQVSRGFNWYQNVLIFGAALCVGSAANQMLGGNTVDAAIALAGALPSAGFLLLSVLSSRPNDPSSPEGLSDRLSARRAASEVGAPEIVRKPSM